MRGLLFISVLLGINSCNISGSSNSTNNHDEHSYASQTTTKLEIGYPCTLRINEPYTSRDSIKVDIIDFHFPNTTIRALEVINDSTVWFAGSNGYWGYTLDNGKNWTTNQFKMDSLVPEFRSISVKDNGDVFLVSIIKPGAVYKSSNMGTTWKMVYTDTDTNAFFDAIDFFDSQNGILLGDAINNCFHVAISNDGGNNWKRVNCENLPSALDNENPFAASNTNISVNGTHAWFGTGGLSKSRVYHTPNYGKTWEVFDTPMARGGTMTGIYSIHFYDSLNGIISGGDWDNVDDLNGSFSYTQDGGKTWSTNNQTDGFSSCVQFIPQTQGQELFKLKARARGGNSSMGFSNNNGKTWQAFTNTNYLSIQFSSKNVAWLSGKEKIGRMVISKY